MYYYNKDRSIVASTKNMKSRDLFDRNAFINRKYNYISVPKTAITSGMVSSKPPNLVAEVKASVVKEGGTVDINKIPNLIHTKDDQLRWIKQPITNTISFKNTSVWYSPAMAFESGVKSQPYMEINVPYGQLCNLPVITSKNGTIITKTTYDVLVQNSLGQWISIFYCCPDLLQHYYIYERKCVLQLKASTASVDYTQNITIKVNPINSTSTPIVHYVTCPTTQSTSDVVEGQPNDPVLLDLDDDGVVTNSTKLDASYNYIYTSSDKIAL